MNASTVQEHYDRVLGKHYAWSTGELSDESRWFKNWIQELQPSKSATHALDLGCGNGVYSLALADLNYQVLSVDFCSYLLSELNKKSKNNIETVQSDIRNTEAWNQNKYDTILCWGDTLTHLDNLEEVQEVLSSAASALNENGILLVSFRNYYGHAAGERVSIPVKMEEELIHTCIITYEEKHVLVHDVFHEKEAGQWTMNESSYRKLILHSHEVMSINCLNGLRTIFQSDNSPVVTLAFKKV